MSLEELPALLGLPGDHLDLDAIFQRPAWWHRGACRGAPSGPAPWFTSRGDGTSAAKAICARCPVRLDCLDYALADDSLTGCWGGTSEAERRRIRLEVVDADVLATELAVLPDHIYGERRVRLSDEVYSARALLPESPELAGVATHLDAALLLVVPPDA